MTHIQVALVEDCDDFPFDVGDLVEVNVPVHFDHPSRYVWKSGYGLVLSREAPAPVYDDEYCPCPANLYLVLHSVLGDDNVLVEWIEERELSIASCRRGRGSEDG